jgi:outer membrane lipoprotein SlyB
MTQTTLRTHPLVVIAATAVILTCLLAIGIMTGIVPAPALKERTTSEVGTLTPRERAAGDSASATAGDAYSPTLAPRAEPRVAREARAPESRPAPHSGSTAGSGPSRSVAGSAPAPACTNCGTVSSVRTVRQQGEAGLLGPAAGGLIGGVIGNQIGSGRGNTIATVVGAAGGAAAGTEIERRRKSTTHYVVGVRMNDGSARSFTYASAPVFQSGDRVRIVDGRLVRD